MAYALESLSSKPGHTVGNSSQNFACLASFQSWMVLSTLSMMSLHKKIRKPLRSRKDHNSCTKSVERERMVMVLLSPLTWCTIHSITGPLDHEGGAAHGDRSGACGTNHTRVLIGSHTLIDTVNEGRVVCRWDYHTVLLGYIFWHISQYGMSLWLRNPQRMQHHEVGELHGHRTCRRPW